MTTTTDAGPARGATPVHLWVAGIVALLWNGFGAYDYLCTNLRGDPYLREMGMTDAQIDYFHSMPAWMTGVWAVGVWGGVLGGLLLLARRRWAFPVFAVSLAAFLSSVAYSYLLSDGGKIMGQQGMIMNLVILAGCLFFTWYAWAMGKRGVLR